VAWTVASQRDRYDNEMRYQYVTTEQTAANNFTVDFRADKILYTYGPTGPADRTISFVYGADNFRQDPRDSYLSGVPLRNGHLLTDIVMSGPAPISPGELKRYKLGYRNGVGLRARLVSVNECDGAGICKEQTVFGWSDPATSFTRIDVGASPVPQNSGIGSTNQMIAADVDGDGLDDLIYSATTPINN